MIATYSLPCGACKGTGHKLKADGEPYPHIEDRTPCECCSGGRVRVARDAVLELAQRQGVKA